MTAIPSAQRKGLSVKELIGIGFLILFVSIVISIMTGVVLIGVFSIILAIAIPTALGIRQHRRKTHHTKAERKQLNQYNQLVMVGEVKEYLPSQDERVKYTGKQYVTEAYDPPIPYSLREYMATKGQNQNIAAMGMSAMGKTTLLYQIIMNSPYHKIIFVVKGFTDKYAQLPIANGHPAPTIYLNGYSPDVFQDRDSFIASFIAAFSPTNQGITAAAIPSLLKQVLSKMKTNTWQEFEEVIDTTLDTINQREKYVDYQALLFIKNNVEFISRDTQYTIQLPPDVIVDFSDMSDQAVGFYGEYLMRQIFNELATGKRQRTTFFIDEGQVFLDQGNRSIMSKLAALIRATGSFVVSTQMLSTIGGPILSNCATQFSFLLTGSEDLAAISRIDPMRSWTVSQLYPHTFVDLNQEGGHSKIILFQVYNPNINTMPPITWTPKEGISEREEEPDLYSTAVENEIYEYIAEVRPQRREAPPGIRDISYYISHKHKWKEKDVQVQLKDNNQKSPLNALIQEGKVSFFYFDYVGRPLKLPHKKLYYQSGNYQAHDYVRDYVMAIIKTRYPNTAASVLNHGESVTDIIWELEGRKYSIEIEMDTKRGGEGQ